MATTIPQPSETQKFSKSISGSIKSLVGGSGRTYFVLEHKTRSEKHKAGESREFIGDYLELGRGSSYAVNFGNDCATVSRPHAAIIRKENGWVIRPLSQTNPTLVNGKRIADEWHLSSGDEIQLSLKGPVVAFLIPPNNTVGTMGISIRMRAVVNEAIKPYKIIIGTLALVFALVIVRAGYVFKGQNDQMGQYRTQIAKMEHRLDTIHFPKPPVADPDVVRPPLPPQSAVIQSLYPSIYYIQSTKITFTVGDEVSEKEYGLSASGFLLKDGTFVTAHHVVEPWLYGNTQADSLLNVIASNGGKVKLSFTAFSPDGSTIDFTTDDFSVDRSADKTEKITIEGKEINFRTPGPDGTDWATAPTNIKGKGLVANKNLSVKLAISTPLSILGYPFGRGANKDDIKPMLSDCIVSRDGLDNGVIDVGNKGFDHGNSGGPVFVKNKQGGYEVIGIVSAGQGSQGFICPLEAIQN